MEVALTLARRGSVSHSPYSGWAAGRGRPPEAAARRAGLEFVEKLLTTRLESVDMTERNASMLAYAPPRHSGRTGYWLWLRVAWSSSSPSPTQAQLSSLAAGLKD